MAVFDFRQYDFWPFEFVVDCIDGRWRAKRINETNADHDGYFDPTPKDLSRWLEAIEWLDMTADDVWTPADLRL